MFFVRTILLYFLLALMLSVNLARANEDGIESFVLPIEDLDIVTASKKSEPAFKAASATFVLTSDDIRRSGATSIPEALRLVPGIEVARSNANKWAVTSRGFNRLHDNKMLVFIDGREQFSPVFTGTNWDVTDLVIEDIDRIEVMRGPATSLWGSNTLNGVVNIITKDARHTQGNYASLLYGTHEKILELRHGGKVDDDLFYRTYFKGTAREDSTSIDILRGDKDFDAGDDWSMAKAGFRVDWDKTLKDRITINGEVHSGTINQKLFIPTLEDQGGIADEEDVEGLSLSASWDHQIDQLQSIKLTAYYDYSARDSLLDDLRRHVLNLDFQHTIQTSDRNELIWGAGYRHIADKLIGSFIEDIPINSYNPEKQYGNIYNAFFQNTFQLVPNELDLIIGAKIEDDFNTGEHLQPSARLRWTPNDRNTIWAAATRGIRKPSRLETTMRRAGGNVGPIVFYWQSNPNFKAETMTSYEVGYRSRPTNNIEIDLSAFYNSYDNVRTFEQNPLNPTEFILFNKAFADTHGVNATIDFNITKNWNIELGYSYLDMDLEFDADSVDIFSEFDDGVSPRHQFQIQSKLNLTESIEFDNTLYYVDSLDDVFIPSYTRWDTRLSWQLNDDIELSFVGQNMLDDFHRETTRSFYSTHNAFGRQLYGQVKWKF